MVGSPDRKQAPLMDADKDPQTWDDLDPEVRAELNQTAVAALKEGAAEPGLIPVLATLLSRTESATVQGNEQS